MEEKRITEQERMEATQEAVRKAFKVLNLPADICIARDDGKTKPYFQIDSYKGSIWDDSPIISRLPVGCQSLEDVASETNRHFRDYNLGNAIRNFTPYVEEIARDPQHFAEDCLYRHDLYCHIADACQAAERIQKGENPEEVYHAYKEQWKEDARKAAQFDCGEHLQRMNRLYGQSYHATREVINSLSEEKERFPIPGQENKAFFVWTPETETQESRCYEFTEPELDALDFDKEFPDGADIDAISIDANGIITSDDAVPDNAGMNFHDAYPMFHAKDSRYPSRQAPPRAETVKDTMLDELKKIAQRYQEAGVSEKDIEKALRSVRKEIPSLTQEKQASR